MLDRFDDNEKRTFLALGLVAASTLIISLLFEVYLDWFSIAWWVYPILWLAITGVAHGQLLEDDANQKIVDGQDPE